MDKFEISGKIEKFAPPELAERWDCSGWIVKTTKTQVNKAMLCLTITPDVVRQAKSEGCDIIISHHPLFEVSTDIGLISKDFEPLIDAYCAHTNMDRTLGGTTDMLVDKLGFDADKNYLDGFLRYVDCDISVEEFCKKLRKISENLRVVNNYGKTKLNRIAFCGGSGSEFIEDACDNGADAIVTGDVKFHTAVDSPILIFDIGHFESEIQVLKRFEQLLTGLEIVFAKEKSPFISV